MFNRLSLLALSGMLALSLVGCASEPPAEQPAAEPAPAEPAPPPAPTVFYELTEDDITTNPDWTAQNVTVLDSKLGDRTNDVIKNFGEQENTRTLAEDYLTVYQRNGLFVYTFKLTGKIRKIEVTETFANRVKDANMKRLLTDGSVDFMRETFGMEESVFENPEDMSTEYVYDSKGFRFVVYRVDGKTLNALRFQEPKRSA